MFFTTKSSQNIKKGEVKMDSNEKSEGPVAEKSLKESICYGSTGTQGGVNRPLSDVEGIRSIPFGSTGPQSPAPGSGSDQNSQPPAPPSQSSDQSSE